MFNYLVIPVLRVSEIAIIFNVEYRLIHISENAFNELGTLLTRRYGIKLPPEKKIMFQSRLQSRLRELKINSFEEYAQYVKSPVNSNTELGKMIEYISTNKTEFFREKQHFDLMLSRILPEIYSRNRQRYRLIRCWSAGCSEGQEAFSMAMTIEEFMQKKMEAWDYFIVGSDVSGKVLNVARRGIYPFNQSAFIPSSYLKKYVLKSRDVRDPKIKIVSSIRSKVTFNYGNLVDSHYGHVNPFNIIFIRNTLIYFDRKEQIEIIQKVLKYLEDYGYLFVGHSESLINLEFPLKLVGSSVYQKVPG